MIEFDLDIPSLTEDGIYMDNHTFENVKELTGSSMIDKLIMIEMLTLLIDSFERRVIICELRGVLKCLLVIDKGTIRVI